MTCYIAGQLEAVISFHWTFWETTVSCTESPKPFPCMKTVLHQKTHVQAILLLLLLLDLLKITLLFYHKSKQNHER